MHRRTDFRDTHQQPDRKGQSSGRAMHVSARPAIELVKEEHLNCKSFALYKNTDGWQCFFQLFMVSGPAKA